ncbi:MAG: hypothetical protein QXT77_07305 [Candidatus Methanomethylicaceae archaeon]
MAMRVITRAAIAGITSIIVLFILKWKPWWPIVLLYNLDMLGILKNKEPIQLAFEWSGVFYYIFLILTSLGFGYIVKNNEVLYGLPVIIANEGLDFLWLRARGFYWKDIHFLLIRGGVFYVMVGELIIWISLAWVGAGFSRLKEKERKEKLPFA